MKELILYLIIINVVSFFVCLYDKRMAISQRRRIAERTLLLLAALGGSTGLYLAMRIFRHKTRHMTFMIGVPLIILAQSAILWFFLAYR